MESGHPASSARAHTIFILSYRHSREMSREVHPQGQWRAPNRIKHFDLTLDRDVATGDASDDSGSDSEGELGLPHGFFRLA